MQPSHEPCASTRGEQTCCIAEATWRMNVLRHQSYAGCATVQCGCGEIRACVQVYRRCACTVSMDHEDVGGTRKGGDGMHAGRQAFAM